MKTKNWLFLSVIIIVLITSCKKSDTGLVNVCYIKYNYSNSNIKSDYLYSKTSNSSDIVEYFDNSGYLEKGEIRNISNPENKKILGYQYFYNDDHSINKYKISDKEEVNFFYTNGKLMRINFDFSIRFFDVFEYNGENISKRVRYLERTLMYAEHIDSSYVFFYKNGLLDSIQHFIVNNESDNKRYSFLYTETFKYNSDNKISKHEVKSLFSDDMAIYNYEYDDQGNICSLLIEDSNISISKFFYKYNEKGFLIQERLIRNNLLVFDKDYDYFNWEAGKASRPELTHLFLGNRFTVIDE